jgi:DNA processing protein
MSISDAVSAREPLPDPAAPRRFGGGTTALAPDPLPCVPCLRRTWLLGELAGRIELARRAGTSRLKLLLALADDDLLHAVGAPPATWTRYREYAPAQSREAAERAQLTVVCRHDTRYPAVLREMPDAPAALHVAGSIERFVAFTAGEQPAVAVVGARRASAYGLEVARGLGRGLASADVTVVSGLALGIDSSAHAGALDASGPTMAILGGGAERPYPASKRWVYEAIRRTGCVISEMPPGAGVHRWCFPARNRLIAALAGLTVVVEAAERSGSLITSEFAHEMGREVGAVPGQVTSPLSRGPNALLADGAHVIRGPEDALDLACGVGEWRQRCAGARVPDRLRALHEAVATGAPTPELLTRRGFSAAAAFSGLAELEQLGHVRRMSGGRYLATLSARAPAAADRP